MMSYIFQFPELLAVDDITDTAVVAVVGKIFRGADSFKHRINAPFGNYMKSNKLHRILYNKYIEKSIRNVK